MSVLFVTDWLMRISRLYDLLAPVYRRVVPPMYDLATSRAAQRLSAGAPANILEVGVGPGHILVAAGQRNPKARAVGVDISAGMLKASRALLGQSGIDADLVRADATRLPFKDRAFEGVVASFMLDLFWKEQIPDALSEMERVLAPGGRIVIASLQFSNPLIKQVRMLTYRLVPEFMARFKAIDFKDFLENTGLRVLQDETIPQAAGTRLLTLVKVRG